MNPTSSSVPAFSLAGKKALVTGASSGIGEAIALAFAEAGADVAVLARGEQVEATAQRIRALGRTAIPLRFDVGDTARIDEVVQDTANKLDGLDILVTAAGTLFRAPAQDYPEAQFDEVMRVNVKSTFLFCQSAARLMIAGGVGGKIITIASMLSFQGGMLVAGYSTSKGAVATMTKAFANDLARHRIQVNAIAPGYIRSRLTEALIADPNRNRGILERIPSGRWGEPEDLKGAAVFLASPASNYVTGHILCVDGGYQSR